MVVDYKNSFINYISGIELSVILAPVYHSNSRICFSNTDLSFYAPVDDLQKNHVSVWQLERSTMPDGSAIGDRDFGFIPDWEPALLTELEHVGDVTDLVVSDCVLIALGLAIS